VEHVSVKVKVVVKACTFTGVSYHALLAPFTKPAVVKCIVEPTSGDAPFTNHICPVEPAKPLW
jgi:hypothetical protein